MEDKIKENARLVIEQMRQIGGFEFGLDPESVEKLDDYIQIQRVGSDLSPDSIRNYVNLFGSYLGECIIFCYGGYWEKEEGRWRVSFDENNAVYPFAKVQKQFDNGAGDSIKSFFDTIPVIFKHSMGKEANEQSDAGKGE